MFEVMGIEIGLAEIALLALLLGWAVLKRMAPRTKTQWDDRLVDVVEGTADAIGLDPDALADRAKGRLKAKIVRK